MNAQHTGDRWRDYLDRFHAGAPGITEALLSCARHDDVDPYGWVAAAVDVDGPVVDVACGSAPLAGHVAHDLYVGVDRSPAELALARARVGDRVVCGDAAALPVADAATATVTCCMGLMLTRPLAAVQAEIRRVLRPGGRLVALLPTRRPAGPVDALRWSVLLAALGVTGLRWPNPQTLDAPASWLQPSFTVVADECRSFAYPLTGTAAARRLVASLYLPGVDDGHIERAVRATDRLIGRNIKIPLRRVVART